MENAGKSSPPAPRKAFGHWIAVMALAVVLIVFYVGKALLKSHSDTDRGRPGEAARPGDASATNASGGRQISSLPEREVIEEILPGGRKVRLITRPAVRRTRTASPSALAYPFDIPSAQEKTWRMLKTSIITLDFTEVDFLEIAAWLTKETGLVIQMDPDIAARLSDVKIWLCVRDLCLDSYLCILLKMCELQFSITEDGRIMVVAGPVEESANLQMQNMLQTLASQPDKGNDEPEVYLLDFDVKWTGEGMKAGPGERVSASEGFDILREITGLNIMVNMKEVSVEVLENTLVDLPPARTTSSGAVLQMTEALGLDYFVKDGVVMVTSKEKAKTEKEEMQEEKRAAEERVARISSILGTTISIGFEGALMWEVAPRLESAIGLPVVTDKETWFSDARVTVAPGSHTVREVLEEVGSQSGARWIVEVDRIYFISK